MVDQKTWNDVLAALCGAAEDFGGVWAERRWMNTPGPVYTADSDFALLGPTNVPEHVALDDERIDIVYRQPCTLAEASRVIRAASIDPFTGYACDGNKFWTPDGVREWWARRGEILRHIEENLMSDSWWGFPCELPVVHTVATSWKTFLKSRAEEYLRKYCYFLDTGKWPSAGDHLPDL